MPLDLLFPNFDELIRKPEDVQRLNEAILQLAVQGKLVAQDPNDEPVKDLLYGIGMWIDETSLSNRVPFSVPHTWQWVRLGELRPEFQNGCSRRTSAPTGIASVVIRLADIVHGAIALNNTRSIGLLPDERRKYHLKSGDILITRVNGSVDLIGGFTLVQEEVDLCYCDHFIRMRIDNQLLHPAYLALVGKSTLIRGQIREKFITTAGQKTVNQTHISTLWLPLAPLAEQLRIVTKVNELFAQTRALEARLRQAQEDVVTVNRAALHRLHTAQDDDQFQTAWRTIRDHFDVLYDDPRNVAELRQTILDLAVRGKLVPQDANDEPAGELLKRMEAGKTRLMQERNIEKTKSPPPANHSKSLFELPPGWEWVKFGVLAKLQSGFAFRSQWYSEAGIRLVRNINIYHGYIDWNNVVYLDYVRGRDFSEFELRQGDILIALDRPVISAGLKVAIVQEVDLPCLLVQRVGRPVFFVGELIDLSYVFRWFGSDVFIGAIDPGHSKGIPHISQKDIEGAPIPIPPLAEQQRIVAKVDQLMRLCDELEAGLARAEEERRMAITAVLL